MHRHCEEMQKETRENNVQCAREKESKLVEVTEPEMFHLTQLPRDKFNDFLYRKKSEHRRKKSED